MDHFDALEYLRQVISMDMAKRIDAEIMASMREPEVEFSDFDRAFLAAIKVKP